MLLLLSPSKTQNFSKPALLQKFTLPLFIEEIKELVDYLKKFSVDELGDFMNISNKLAEVNFGKYKNFQTSFDLNNANQALLAFDGDVYEAITSNNYSSDDWNFAQDTVRIISGLYGLLKPLDLIQAYRLEMSMQLKTDKGKNLYQYWGNKITNALGGEYIANKDNIIINLASEEYFKVINTNLVQAKIITPIFKDFIRNKYQTVGLFAKRARGMMTEYIVKNRVKDIEGIKLFSIAGYSYDEISSTSEHLVFLRKEK